MFYIFVTESGEVHISPLKEDIRLGEKVELLLPGLPLSLARSLLHTVQGKKPKAGLKFPFIGRSFRRAEGRPGDAAWLKREILQLLLKKPSLASHNWRWESRVNLKPGEIREGQAELPKTTTSNGGGGVDVYTEDPKLRDFQSRTAGRLLAKADLQRLGQECGLAFSEILNLCQEQVAKGWAEWIPAVVKVGKGWRCQRCGETELEEWTSIYGLAATCPACTSIGAVSSLQWLYRSLDFFREMNADHHAPSTQSPESPLEPPFVFSPRWELSCAQKLAAQEILAFVQGEWTPDLPRPKVVDPLSKSSLMRKENSGQEILLWAACGAGKTEVCFPAIAWALERGKRVLFAAPRQDVVLDVAPRLQRDFPGLKLSILTGTSPERFTPASFVLATTHQILRFFRAFDLIFLDEMDAFPYYGNKALGWGLEQALRPGGKIIYLTATPSPESLEKVRQGRMGLLRLPARHHRQAVPVPQWRRISGGLEPTGFRHRGHGQKFFSWVKELSQAGPVLLFVPKISWVTPWVEILQKEFTAWEISGSYSADPQRREKIEGLQSKKFRIFVSTSILERGVTIPDAQVMILEANHEVFDERALVQMAGRVGRTKENPTGSAYFLSSQKTPAIDTAIRWIKEQNELALAQGLIDP